MSITNHASIRELELTSYAEVVLAPHAADLAHPAFSNLFIETTAVPAHDALMAARRPRSGTAPVSDSRPQRAWTARRAHGWADRTPFHRPWAQSLSPPGLIDLEPLLSVVSTGRHSN